MVSVMVFFQPGGVWGQLEVALPANASITHLVLTAPLGNFGVSIHVATKLTVRLVVLSAYFMILLCFLMTVNTT